MVTFYTWILDNKTRADDGQTSPLLYRSWHKVKIVLNPNVAKRMCCWQQQWGVGLPADAVDWEIVNTWSQGRNPINYRADAQGWFPTYAELPENRVYYADLAVAIRQSVDMDYWTQFQDQQVNPLYGPLKAPEGYSCGMLLYPGKGCDSYEDDDVTSGMDDFTGRMAAGSDAALTSGSDAMMTYAGDAVEGFDVMVSDIASSLTFGITTPIRDGLEQIVQEIADARTAAESAEKDVWTFKWRTGIFSNSEVEVNVLDILPGGEQSLISVEAAGWIKKIITVLVYFFGARMALGMILPKTISPFGGGGGGDRDDD